MLLVDLRGHGGSQGSYTTLGGHEREDVRSVIVEAPFRHVPAHDLPPRSTPLSFARLVPAIPLAIAAAEWRADFDADGVDAVEAARRTRAPLFAIVDGGDPRALETVVRTVWDAPPGPKTFWLAPGAEHVGAVWHPEFWPRVMAFLQAHGL